MKFYYAFLMSFTIKILYSAIMVQSIAAFPTRNAANDSAIHKVILQAVVKLEACGAEVLSVVCDGAKPNKSFWKLCGVGYVGSSFINKVFKIKPTAV